jgi:hypothetical protein
MSFAVTKRFGHKLIEEMKRYQKIILWSLLSVVILIGGFSSYYVFNLPFDYRVQCAAGDWYVFAPSLCRAYIKAFSTGNTPQEREQMSASLHILMSIYDANKRNAKGKHALELADLFIRRGADINYAVRGWTPLDGAAIFGDPVLARFLLKRGADPRVKTSPLSSGKKVTALEIAIASREGVKRSQPTKNWDEFNIKGLNKVIAILREHSQKARSPTVTGHNDISLKKY